MKFLLCVGTSLIKLCRQSHLDMTESQEKTDIPRIFAALSRLSRGSVCVCGEDVAANVKYLCQQHFQRIFLAFRFGVLCGLQSD